MSAWSNDFTNAPQDKMFLMNHPDWKCPAIVQYRVYVDYHPYGHLKICGKPIYEYVEKFICELDPGVYVLDTRGDHKYTWTNIPD